ncbi:hypothetical protein HDU97_006545 [Phlyctochytrium planicorne]|nr:hypothetical protein HDU97_006545 [Phlyctochytrium planicorne]
MSGAPCLAMFIRKTVFQNHTTAKADAQELKNCVICSKPQLQEGNEFGIMIDRGVMRGRRLEEWRHWGCIDTALLMKIGKTSSIKNFDALPPSDRKRIRRALKEKTVNFVEDPKNNEDAEEENEDTVLDEHLEQNPTQNAATDQPVKRGRGRPRKIPVEGEDKVEKEKRKRGRPRKVADPTTVSDAGATYGNEESGVKEKRRRGRPLKTQRNPLQASILNLKAAKERRDSSARSSMSPSLSRATAVNPPGSADEAASVLTVESSSSFCPMGLDGPRYSSIPSARHDTTGLATHAPDSESLPQESSIPAATATAFTVESLLEGKHIFSSSSIAPLEQDTREEAPETPPKRKRGRPRKEVSDTAPKSSKKPRTEPVSDGSEPVKRGRGRPRKYFLVDSTTTVRRKRGRPPKNRTVTIDIDMDRVDSMSSNDELSECEEPKVIFKALSHPSQAAIYMEPSPDWEKKRNVKDESLGYARKKRVSNIVAFDGVKEGEDDLQPSNLAAEFVVVDRREAKDNWGFREESGVMAAGVKSSGYQSTIHSHERRSVAAAADAAWGNDVSCTTSAMAMGGGTDVGRDVGVGVGSQGQAVLSM